MEGLEDTYGLPMDDGDNYDDSEDDGVEEDHSFEEYGKNFVVSPSGTYKLILTADTMFDYRSTLVYLPTGEIWYEFDDYDMWASKFVTFEGDDWLIIEHRHGSYFWNPASDEEIPIKYVLCNTYDENYFNSYVGEIFSDLTPSPDGKTIFAECEQTGGYFITVFDSTNIREGLKELKIAGTDYNFSTHLGKVSVRWIGDMLNLSESTIWHDGFGKPIDKITISEFEQKYSVDLKEWNVTKLDLECNNRRKWYKLCCLGPNLVDKNENVIYYDWDDWLSRSTDVRRILLFSIKLKRNPDDPNVMDCVEESVTREYLSVYSH